MKKKKVILGISVLLVALIVIGVFVIQQPQEKVIIKFLSDLYTVTDYKFINNLKNTTDVEQVIINASAPYKDLFTEKGLDQILSNRIPTVYNSLAQEFNSKFYVDKINLNKKTKVDNDTFQYFFEVFINVNNDGEKVINQKGIIVIKKVNSIWKIDFLKILNPQDIRQILKQ